jgi:hypothetical protein
MEYPPLLIKVSTISLSVSQLTPVAAKLYQFVDWLQDHANRSPDHIDFVLGCLATALGPRSKYLRSVLGHASAYALNWLAQRSRKKRT